ncbi:MAG: sulfite exporter TauE/SafE family protein [Deltaproteobacteria bacterium]|nr:sulfite exporter TauE/SafE family protein [Deltaproteobacteria bacterium]
MLSFAGFVTGFLVGLTGVGGGALMTPLLLMVFGVAPTTAVGTDLWFAAITKLAGSGVHHARGFIDWPVARRLWAGSLPAAALTMAAIRWGGLTLDVSWLKPLIAWVVLVTALGIVFQRRLHQVGERLRTVHVRGFKRLQPGLTLAAGAAIGILVTLTSIGAGALGAALLTFLYPFRLPPARLAATDMAHAIPLAVFAGLGYALLGQVDLVLLGWLLLGSLPGVFLGAVLSTRLPQPVLRGALAVVLAAAGVKLLTTA